MTNSRMAFIIGLIVIAALIRFIPHPPNFSPIAAIALFGGAYLADKRLAFVLPLLVMLLTDLVLGLHSVMPFVYVAFVITVLLGMRLGQSPRAKYVAATAVGSGVVFFVLTNFGVWLMSGMYTLDMAGLISCYTLALPFFQNTLLANLVFAGCMFGIMAWLEAQYSSEGTGAA